MNAERLLTPEEVADLLRAKKNTLAIWRMKGTGPAFIKRGRLVFYTPEAVRDYINGQTRTKTGTES